MDSGFLVGATYLNVCLVLENPSYQKISGCPQLSSWALLFLLSLTGDPKACDYTWVGCLGPLPVTLPSACVVSHHAHY